MMKQMISNWDRCKIKGDLGELLIDQLLTPKYRCYKPCNDGAYPIDRILIKDSKIIVYDIKTKPKRDKYASTGYDYNDHKHYLALNKTSEVWIFFVDENLGGIYYQSLNNLIDFKLLDDGNGNLRSHPFIEQAKNHKTQKVEDVIYFHIDQLKLVRKLKPEEILKLKELPNEI